MADRKRPLSGAAKAASERAAARRSSSASSSRRAAGDTRGRYTADAVRRAFGGAITFGGGYAQAVADKLNDLEGLGSMHPDEAGRRVQAAVTEALEIPERVGAAVSIDTAIAALTSMHAEQAFEGEQVGGPDTPVETVERSVPAGGTAAATGAASAGPGAGAEPGASA